MKKRAKINRCLENHLKDPGFSARLQKAGEALHIGGQLAVLRKASGLSQKELAEQVGTSQQQISRLESTSYEGHSLSMIRRVAGVLGAKVRVEIEKDKHLEKPDDAEATEKYNAGQPLAGAVSARKCPCCGHHEIGVVTDSGEFVALKPGWQIRLEKRGGAVDKQKPPSGPACN